VKFHWAILRCAAWLVPAEDRGEWLAEWRSELFYVRRSRTAFCLGSFRDALWLRWNRPRHARGILQWESPLECLLFLAMVAAASVLVAVYTPLAREILVSPYPDTPDLVTISAHTKSAAPSPTIPIEQFQSWTKTAPSPFSGMAFYQMTHLETQIAGHRTANLSVARASGQFFELLKIPAATVQPGLFLSRPAWLRYFHGDRRMIGRVLEIGGQPVEVAGILEEGAWRLPGGMDAWLIEDDRHLAQLPAGSRGYVLGRLRGVASRPPHGLRHISLPNQQGGSSAFDCISPSERGENPLITILSLMVLGTLLVLRVSSSMSLDGMRKPRQWVFFSVKLALLVPIVILGSLDVTLPIAKVAHLHLEPAGLVAAWFLSIRWALRDQQQRCPVCLRLLINPVGIGQASQTFLGWYGTELMCAKGHGMLQLPELPCSSYSESRWIQLDPSWSGLF
jgi:hypothetical protein